MGVPATSDGTQIDSKDWGAGQPVVFSYRWPLNADSWEAHMLFLANKGYRCLAHARRGHAACRCSSSMETTAESCRSGPVGKRPRR